MLALRGVRFGYRHGADVLRGVSAACEPGITCIIGPNGAGKTTLLRIAAGLIRPREGAAELDGTNTFSMPAAARARRIAFVGQRGRVTGVFTVEQVVRLGQYAVGDDQAAVERAMDRLGILGLRDRLYAELSVGQQQRVSLARALAQLGGDCARMEGRVLVADEPTSALDPAHIVQCARELREVGASGGIVVIATHDLQLARACADGVVGLTAEGAVAFAGPARGSLGAAGLSGVFGTPFVDAGGVLVADGLRGPAV